jgi:hypothetical protein
MNEQSFVGPKVPSHRNLGTFVYMDFYTWNNSSFPAGEVQR